MKADIVLITPELASKWLQNNLLNRNISQRQVDKIVSEMRAGNWRLTHQGIAFYSDGVLADGQHRLEGIVQSGLSQTMLVTTGLERIDATGIDQHRPRSVVDTIKISRGSDWINKDAVAISRYLLSNSGSKIPTVTEICNFAEYNKDSIQFCTSCFTIRRRGLSASTVMAAVVLADMNQADRADLSLFVSILLSGMATSPFQGAAIRLREWLMRAPTRGQADVDANHLRTQRALQAFINRQPITKLYLPSEPIWILPDRCKPDAMLAERAK